MLDIEKIQALLSQIANADTAQTASLELMELIQAENATNETLSTTNNQNAERIRALQDTNQKLFLKLTTNASESEPPEKSGAEMLEAFTKEYFNKGDN